MRFISKFRWHQVKINGKYVEFKDGIFESNDIATIEGLKKCSDFGIKYIAIDNTPIKPKVTTETSETSKVDVPEKVEEKSFKQYSCKKCSFKTENLSEFRSHVVTHRPKR